MLNSLPTTSTWPESKAVRRGSSGFFLHCAFDDLRVDPGHSIHSVRAHNAQVSHVDLLHVSFLNQGHAAQTVDVPRVQFGDALQRLKNSQSIFSVSGPT